MILLRKVQLNEDELML